MFGIDETLPGTWMENGLAYTLCRIGVSDSDEGSPQRHFQCCFDAQHHRAGCNRLDPEGREQLKKNEGVHGYDAIESTGSERWPPRIVILHIWGLFWRTLFNDSAQSVKI